MTGILGNVPLVNDLGYLNGRLSRLKEHLEDALDWKNDKCAFSPQWKYIELTRQRIKECEEQIEKNKEKNRAAV